MDKVGLVNDQKDVKGDGGVGVDVGVGELLKGHIPHTPWYIIAIEASDQHTVSLTKARDTLLANPRVHTMEMYTQYAVCTHDNPITYIACNHTQTHTPSRTSPCDTPGTTMNESLYATYPYTHTYTIPCIDIHTLFTIHDIHTHDFVIIKMDIEGGEYELVPHIVKQKLWMRIDKLAVEW
ncbi:hypothetical protein EON63_04830 [archaeon]|nr:MAG: hypothetical protein EON63_04830 [archaeon]